MLVKYIRYLIFLLIVMQSWRAYTQNGKSYREKYYDELVPKIDVGLIHQSKNYFYAGCTLLFAHSNGLFDKHWIFHGPIITGEVILTPKTIFTPKIGYYYIKNFFSLQANAGMHTNFKSTSGFISPQAGVSLFGAVDVYYAHEFNIGGKPETHFTNRLGISFILPVH